MNTIELKKIYNIINSKTYHRKAFFERDKLLYLTNDCVIFVYKLKENKNKKIIVKKVSSKSKCLSNNSFFLGRFALNKIKEELPNFRYTFGYEEDNRKQTLYLEYLKGCTFKQFLLNNLYNDDPNKLELFHNFILQIILSLESIQSKIKFTHYDLHLENLLICPLKTRENFKFVLANQTIELKNMGYLIQFIDFDFSTASTIRYPILYQKIVPFGYTGIFLAGTDLLRLFFCIKKKVEFCNESFGKDVKEFVKNIFSNYFEITFDSNDTTSFSKHEHIYFCMMNQKQVFYTPLSLLHFIYNYRNDLLVKQYQFIQEVEIDTNHCETGLNEHHHRDIYIPLLTSSKDSIEMFIRKYQNVQESYDSFIFRMVQSLQDLIFVYDKYKIPRLDIHPTMRQVKYLKQNF